LIKYTGAQKGSLGTFFLPEVEKMERNQPEKKFVAGSISATIWKNASEKDGKEFSFESITLSRNFKDHSGNWKSTSSMRLNDLPKAEIVLKKAYEYLTFREAQ
jgi:hypothetical protein